MIVETKKKKKNSRNSHHKHVEADQILIQYSVSETSIRICGVVANNTAEYNYTVAWGFQNNKWSLISSGSRAIPHQLEQELSSEGGCSP